MLNQKWIPVYLCYVCSGAGNWGVVEEWSLFNLERMFLTLNFSLNVICFWSLTNCYFVLWTAQETRETQEWSRTDSVRGREAMSCLQLRKTICISESWRRKIQGKISWGSLPSTLSDEFIYVLHWEKTSAVLMLVAEFAEFAGKAWKSKYFI